MFCKQIHLPALNAFGILLTGIITKNPVTCTRFVWLIRVRATALNKQSCGTVCSTKRELARSVQLRQEERTAYRFNYALAPYALASLAGAQLVATQPAKHLGCF